MITAIVLGVFVFGLAVGWFAFLMGRLTERAHLRHESGWWEGFKRGREHAFKKLQAELLEKGVVLEAVLAKSEDSIH